MCNQTTAFWELFHFISTSDYSTTSKTMTHVMSRRFWLHTNGWLYILTIKSPLTAVYTGKVGSAISSQYLLKYYPWSIHISISVRPVASSLIYDSRALIPSRKNVWHVRERRFIPDDWNRTFSGYQIYIDGSNIQPSSKLTNKFPCIWLTLWCTTISF